MRYEFDKESGEFCVLMRCSVWSVQNNTDMKTERLYNALTLSSVNVQSSILKGGHIRARGISVQMHEESSHPFVHQLVVLPAMQEFGQQRDAVLHLDFRQHLIDEVVLNRPVVEGTQIIGEICFSLGTHVIAGGVDWGVFFGWERVGIFCETTF